MTPGDFALKCVAEAWTSKYRFGILETTLRRPGRGQTARSTNRAGRPIEDRTAVLDSFNRLTADVVEGLRSGGATAAGARAKIDAAGFSEAIQVSESAAEMAEQLEWIFRSGDNVWADCSPAEVVVYLRFWSDKGHRRIG